VSPAVVLTTGSVPTDAYIEMNVLLAGPLDRTVESAMREVMAYEIERAAMMISDWAQRRGGSADALAYGEHRYAELVYELRSGQRVGRKASVVEAVPVRVRGTYEWDTEAEAFAAVATTAQWLAFIDQVGEWIVSAAHHHPDVVALVNQQRTLYLSLDLGDRDGRSA
jgi:hypothetical protein